MMSTNIKFERDEFVRIFYDVYHRLRNNDLFEKGFENFNFKIWKYDKIHYIFVKDDGLLVQWEEMLSYKLCANKKLTEGHWIRIVQDLDQALDDGSIPSVSTDVYNLGERL